MSVRSSQEASGKPLLPGRLEGLSVRVYRGLNNENRVPLKGFIRATMRDRYGYCNIGA